MTLLWFLIYFAAICTNATVAELNLIDGNALLGYSNLVCMGGMGTLMFGTAPRRRDYRGRLIF